jgi:methionyl-tRNA formyltransferase
MKCSDTKPGKVSVEKNRIFVDCADGKLEILSLQQSGKKRMDSDAFTRGFDLSEIYFK